MAGTRTAIRWVVDLGLAAAFLGLGVLGAALIVMAMTLQAAVPSRVIVFVLGVGGLLLGLGYLVTVRRQLPSRSA